MLALLFMSGSLLGAVSTLKMLKGCGQRHNLLICQVHITVVIYAYTCSSVCHYQLNRQTIRARQDISKQITIH